MTALMPYVFRTGAIVDGESINGNLRRSAADINRNLSKRYTNCPPIIVPLDGVTQASTAALRTIRFARPTANHPIEIVRVEFYCYAASGVTWTLSATGTGVVFNSITLATAGTTVESYAVSTTPMQVPSGAGIDFVVSGDVVGTLTRAWLVIHCRADRGVQGASPPSLQPFSPAFVDASTSSAGSVLDTQLTNLGAAVLTDQGAGIDLRGACFVARGFSTAQDWNLPSGQGMVGLAANIYIVATAADAFTTGGTVSATTITGTGTSNIVSGTATVLQTVNSPTAPANDFTLTLGTIVGTVELGYIFVWWS